MFSNSAKCPASIIRSASSSTRNLRFLISLDKVSSYRNGQDIREREKDKTRLFHDVPQTARCGDQNINSTVQDPSLLLSRHSTYNRSNTDTRGTFPRKSLSGCLIPLCSFLLALASALAFSRSFGGGSKFCLEGFYRTETRIDVGGDL